MAEKVTTARYEYEDSHSLQRYQATGGYQALKKVVLELTPDELIELVKAAGLRGRGGAGFPTGMKWSFVPKDVFPKYVVVNNDEGEPGTFKDRELTEKDPHAVVEGALIAAWAIQAEAIFIYNRGEFMLAAGRLEEAIAAAYEQGFAGKGICGSNWRCEIVLYRGAGAYICGEETALLDSLEGFRGQPRLRPPFPAIRGLYGQPTVVNNSETLATLPPLLLRGTEWFRSAGTEKSPGTKIFSVSGHVVAPGNYEVPLGTPLGALLEMAGGIRDGRSMKFVIPGGASAPWLTSTDVDMDFESLAAAGTMLGSGAVVFADETACAVRTALVTTRFFNHESCGKCTPCREGTWWGVKVLARIEAGGALDGDLDLLLNVCDQMDGRSFCPLGDAAAWALRSSVKLFRDEYQAHVDGAGCTVRGGRPAGVGAH